MSIIQMLREAGIDEAANLLENKIYLSKRMEVAYSHYKFIEPSILEKFCQQLKEKSYKRDSCKHCNGSGKSTIGFLKKIKNCNCCKGDGWISERYEKLILTDLKEYKDAPPMDCLLDLKRAKDMEYEGKKVFDRFEIGQIKEEIKANPKIDPVVFGIIDGCIDKFCITQWDDDVSFEQIKEMGSNE